MLRAGAAAASQVRKNMSHFGAPYFSSLTASIFLELAVCHLSSTIQEQPVPRERLQTTRSCRWHPRCRLARLLGLAGCRADKRSRNRNSSWTWKVNALRR